MFLAKLTALIVRGGGGGGEKFMYSFPTLLISFEINFILKEISWAELIWSVKSL